MFNRNSGGKEFGGETIIAQGVKVEGDFTSNGNVVIEGEVTGSVTTSGDLTVGQSARIHADVRAANAIVAGEIRGNIHVDDKLDLASSSKIRGDIEVGIFVVAAGAIVNGKVTMSNGAEAKHAKAKASEEEIQEEE